MGAVRMRVQTANKNIKTAHTTPVHQHLVTWKAACLYETNPSLRHVNFKSSLLAKTTFHNPLLHSLQWKSPFPVVHSHQNPPTFLFKTFNEHTWSVHIYLLIQQDDLSFTDESNIMNREMVCKKHLGRFFYITLNSLIDGLESCGLLEGYCDVLSAVCILILTVPINYRGSIVEQVMQCSLSPNPFRWRNKFTSSINASSANFHFGVSYSFNKCAQSL